MKFLVTRYRDNGSAVARLYNNEGDVPEPSEEKFDQYVETVGHDGKCDYDNLEQWAEQLCIETQGDFDELIQDVERGSCWVDISPYI